MMPMPMDNEFKIENILVQQSEMGACILCACVAVCGKRIEKVYKNDDKIV